MTDEPGAGHTTCDGLEPVGRCSAGAERDSLRAEDWSSLRIFREVTVTGSISAAARALGLSQPSVTRHVRRLERRLNAQLLVRGARGVTMTPRGLEVRQICDVMYRATAELDELDLDEPTAAAAG